jgi:hypothetical protein
MMPLRLMKNNIMGSAAIFLVVIYLCACAAKTETTAGPQGTAPPHTGCFPRRSLGAAGPTKEGKEPSRVFWPKGIQIQYTSSPNLNYYENKAHTILLVVYQFKWT